jgi:transcriptional regulator with PAS, ATPase and Fis domain
VVFTSSSKFLLNLTEAKNYITLVKKKHCLYFLAMTSELQKNFNSSKLLLPHLPDLLVRRTEGGFQIESIPDWLVKLLKIRPDEVGKNELRNLDVKIPGLLELVKGVADSGNPISGFQTVVFDEGGNLREMVMVGSPHFFPDGGEGVSVNIQDTETLAGHSGIADYRNAVFEGLVGKSPPMLRVFNKVRLYSQVDSPVLIFGETGAGKEGIARALHSLSKRSGGPMIPVNCSAISENLFESELFGHEKGSFTGAIRSHKGRFERAQGGTLFLDEIGDLPLSLQAKLLRVLEEEIIERVGTETPIKVNVRVIAATNKNLEEEIAKNAFRADLFYRINALQINVPPLRERIEDIPLLVSYFVDVLNRKYNRNVRCLSPEAVKLLQQYKWPGNVRELRNLMERLFAENQTQVIGLNALREWYEERVNAAKFAKYDPRVTILPYRNIIRLGMNSPDNPESVLPPESQPLMESRIPHENRRIDEETIRQAFVQARGNMTKAASILGIHKATLYRYLKAFNLTREQLETQTTP